METFAELWEAAFAPVNVVYTILLIGILVYWIICIIGLVDIGGGLDLDVDLDADIDGVAGTSTGAVFNLLNMGEVPILIYGSIIVVVMWVASLQINDWLGNDNIWIALLLAVPIFMTGLIAAKLITEPLRVINRMKQRETKLEGRVCRVTSGEVNDQYGECEITTKDAPYRVNARTQDGEVLRRGDDALVVDHVKEENGLYTYIVTKHTG